MERGRRKEYKEFQTRKRKTTRGRNGAKGVRPSMLKHKHRKNIYNKGTLISCVVLIVREAELKGGVCNFAFAPGKHDRERESAPNKEEEKRLKKRG